MRVLLVGLLTLLLSACTVASWNERLSTPEERAFAEQNVRAIQSGDMRWLAKVADPDTMGNFSAKQLAQIRALTPAGPANLITVTVSTLSSGSQTATYKTFSYELGAGQRWAMLQIYLHPASGSIQLAGLHVFPLDRSPSEANALSFAGKGAIHYLWLALMVAAVATSLTAFVLILRTPGLKLKWLWAVGSLLAFANFQLNWTTGEWGIWPISFLLFGASGFRSDPLLPWVMSFGIPIVAVLFLVRRALRSRTAESEVVE